MISLRCVIERITYQNPENGFAILKGAVKGYSDLVTLVGYLFEVNAGSILVVEGDWKNDPKFGRQFIVDRWHETVPATAFGIEKYLGSGLIKGVGPKFAKRIVSQFGSDTLMVIDDTPDRLIEVPGIGQKRVELIKASWQKQKEVKNVMLFLQEHGVSTSFAAKIYKEYGNDSISKVKENPFRLADDIWGIGFRTADSIAQKIGYAKDSYERCRSGISFALNELSNSGHVFAQREQLTKKASELLEVDERVLNSAVSDMISSGDLILDDDSIYLPPFYYSEVGTATKLLTLFNSSGKTIPPLPDISAIESRTGVSYDSVQANAISMAMQSKVMVLTGGPGTGKTTTTQGIISAFKSSGLTVLLAAPTGRAAKRMNEATGMEAKTIHRLLEYKPPEGYQRNEQNPLEGDVLIIDESSMIDIVLMNSLLKAVPPDMRLILVGDIDQLPSVGPGNVLRDIIDSGKFPVVTLTRIFRQAQSSRIVMNAHRINKGKFPDISNGKLSDFFFIQQEDPDRASELIIDLIRNRLPKAYPLSPSDIQVLTPMQRGTVGSSNLNLLIQEAVNPVSVFLRHGGTEYRLHDKVMQIKNNYDKDVFNGDIGTITNVNLEDSELTVSFDNRSVKYDISDLDELVLSYACTVHKAQGSEYPVVIMPLLMSHYMLLQRNLVYTGITRAKKLLVIVGTKKALSFAIRNYSVHVRNTKLKERLSAG